MSQLSGTPGWATSQPVIGYDHWQAGSGLHTLCQFNAFLTYSCTAALLLLESRPPSHIQSAGAWSEEYSMVTAAGMTVIKLEKGKDKDKFNFVGFANGGPKFVITGGLGAMAGAQGTVSISVEKGGEGDKGKPTAKSTFNITLPKQKPEKMNKAE
jgi:hypothetical protein